MIDVNSVNPMALPSMPITMKKGLPVCPSIYFVLEGKEVVYIGRSVNLNNRWKNHHRFSQLSQDAVIAWLEISDESLLDSVEKALIYFFDPSLNKTKVSKDPALLLREEIPSLEKFIKYRKDKGLSQCEIAARVGITDQTVSNWEKNVSEPRLSPKQFKALAETLGVSMNELMELMT